MDARVYHTKVYTLLLFISLRGIYSPQREETAVKTLYRRKV